jgi:hypothetical protein
MRQRLNRAKPQQRAVAAPVPSRPAVPSDPTAAGILQLQQLSGNDAVQRLLIGQRQPAGTAAPPQVAAGPLSPDQVARAKRFYTAQPARYTRNIIMEIQFEVGTLPTGRMSDLDVQAVARRQAELNVNASPPLKIDGMAGPRTLPTIFKIGLAKDANVSSYTAKAREKFNNPNGKSEQDIGKDIVDTEINPRLAAEGIPPIKFKIVNGLGSRGAFSSADWELKLDDLQFQPGDKHDLKDTTATMYHEARHAEQDFRVGQMLAGRKKTAAQITEETGLNADIAKLAFQSPLAPGTMEAVIAEGWHDSLNSPEGLEKRRRNSIELKAAFNEREAARKANKENPSPANAARQTKAEARFDRAVAEHDDLPHEFDAERLETKVRQQF